MFDVVKYLRSQGFPLIERGRNVARNHVNIRCPWCGAADETGHLGINLTTGNWGCWRDPKHRGSRPHRLLRQLFGYDWSRIESLIRAGSSSEDTLDQIEAALASFGNGVPKLRPVIEAKTFDAGLFQLSGYNQQDAGACGYLQSRGFAKEDLPSLCDQYSLRTARFGTYKLRLTFPIYFKGELVGWTSRAMVKSEVRYLTYPPGDEVKRLLYNFDQAAQGGAALCVVEGPFDAMKFDFYAQSFGVRAVGVLGAAVTEAQIALLLTLAPLYDEVWLMLDDDALHLALDLQSKLPGLNSKIVQVPFGQHDPGSLSKLQVQATVEKELNASVVL